MKIETCSNCWSDKITFISYQWIRDRALEIECSDCGVAIHRETWYEILERTLWVWDYSITYKLLGDDWEEYVAINDVLMR
jgi:hypothetical protein